MNVKMRRETTPFVSIGEGPPLIPGMSSTKGQRHLISGL